MTWSVSKLHKNVEEQLIELIALVLKSWSPNEFITT